MNLTEFILPGSIRAEISAASHSTYPTRSPLTPSQTTFRCHVGSLSIVVFDNQQFIQLSKNRHGCGMVLGEFGPSKGGA